jgi:tetratricopeptide (TPR) repeat protein
LLLDWWPLGRLGGASGRSLASLACEKIPLFVLSAASSVVTFVVQREGGAVASFGHLPLDHRISNAALSYVEYLAKMLLPLNLSIFYPYLGYPSSGRLIAAVFILLAVTAAAVIGARRLPYLPVGWFWYLGTLVPVIGLVQVGSQAMADRYTYLPLIGIFILLAWGLNDLLRTRPHRRVLFALISGLILSGLVIMTQAQADFWKESVTLFAQAIRNTDRNYYAHHTLAMALSQKGDFTGAESQYREALRFKPSFPEAQGGLGYVLMIQGRYEEGVGHFESALRVKPGYMPALKHFGDLRMRQERVDDALALYRKALPEGKEDYELFNNYGVALFARGEREEALRNIREALRIKPDYAEARENLRKILDNGEGR